MALCGRRASGGAIAFNAAPHERDGVPALSAGPTVSVVGRGAGAPTRTVLENDHIRVELNADGHIVSLVDRVADREVIPPGPRATSSSSIRISPTTGRHGTSTRSTAIPGRTWALPRASRLSRAGRARRPSSSSTPLGTSRAVQTLAFGGGQRALVVETEVDWHEHERLLKVALPVDVHADRSTSEIQFGHLQRPTHTNTSWDIARFEYVAHRFVHVGEAGYGVAMVNRRDIRPRGDGPREAEGGRAERW